MLRTSIPRRAELGLAAALFVFAALLFSPALSAPFLYDDRLLILGQARLHDLSRWPEWFTGGFWPPMLGQGLYRPLVLATFALTWALVGPSAWAFHATNIALHVLVVALVWWGGRRIGLSPLAAGFAALLFAVHPVHVEVVAAIAYRTDSLATAAVVLAIGVHLGRSAHDFSRRQMSAVAALFALALGCKESALVLIPLLIAAEATLRPTRWRDAAMRRRLLALAALLVLIAAAHALIKVRVGGQWGVPPGGWAYPESNLWSRLPIVPWTLGQYTRLLLWPMTLSAAYSHSLPEPTLGRVALGAATVVLAALAWLAVAVRIRRRRPRLAFALLWVGLALAPYLHIVAFGAVLAERFAYLASVGLCWIVGDLWDAAPARRRLPLGAVLALICVLFAGRAVRHTRAWADPVRLWETSAAVSPESFGVWFGLGNARLEAGDPAGAAEALREAVRLAPGSVLARAALADAEMALGRPDEAERTLREALEISPSSPAAISRLAEVLVSRDRPHEAEQLLLQGIESLPDSPRLWFNLAVAHLANGDRAGAAEALARAEQLGYADAQRVAHLRRLLE